MPSKCQHGFVACPECFPGGRGGLEAAREGARRWVEQKQLREDGWLVLVAGKMEEPNPVVATRFTRDGGTARLYKDGTVDAVDGESYSVSPGFTSFGDLESWVGRKSRVNQP